MACSEAANKIRDEIVTRRATGEAMLRDRFERAVSAGEMSPELDPADYARYIMTVLEGMSVQAAGGASRDGSAQGRRHDVAHLAGLTAHCDAALFHPWVLCETISAFACVFDAL